MSKAAELAELARQRAEWDALISSIDPQRMTEPGVAGDWSIKDIVAHVAWYEWWTAEFIRTRDWPKLPPHLDFEETLARNEAYYHEMRNAPLDEVLASADRTYDELLAALQGTSDAEYADQTLLGMPPGPEWSLDSLIGKTHSHYAQHAPDIRRWLQSSGRPSTE